MKTFKTALVLSGASFLMTAPAMAQQATAYNSGSTVYENRTYGDYSSQHINNPVVVGAGFESVQAESEAIRLYQQNLQPQTTSQAGASQAGASQAGASQAGASQAGASQPYEYPLAKTYSSREAALQSIQIELYDTPIPSASGSSATYASTTYAAPTTTYSNSAYASSQSHVVAAGETLYAIGRIYGLQPSDIMNANGLSGSAIQPGQVLTIPSNTTTLVQSMPVQSRNTTTRIVNVTPVPGNAHAVLPGDTLYSLARRYCTTPSAIASASGIGASSVLSLGQQLTLPSGSCQP